jgi:hypothetical protein
MQGIGELTCHAIMAMVKPQLAVRLAKDVDLSLPGADFFSHLHGNNSLLKTALIGPDWPMTFTTIQTHYVSEAVSKLMVAQADLRWLRFACYFRPDWQSKTSWQATRPREFLPWCRLIRVKNPKIHFVDCPLPPAHLLNEALQSTLIGLASDDQECTGLAVVAFVEADDDDIVTIGLYVPDGFDFPVTTVLRSSGLNWWPSESPFFESGGSEVKNVTCLAEERFNLMRVLGGLESGARNPTSRTNLGRKRLT